jgi:hypothetical protein
VTKRDMGEGEYTIVTSRHSLNSTEYPLISVEAASKGPREPIKLVRREFLIQIDFNFEFLWGSQDCP